MDELPRTSTRRTAMEKVTEAAISTIRIVGGPLAVAFATIAGFSVSKRTDAWLEDLAAELRLSGSA